MGLDPNLEKLIRCHSTPGDEDEVARVLLSHWRETGWVTKAHGRYAVSACSSASSNGTRPVLLICAHMDSPGFSVQTIAGKTLGLTALGGIRFDGEATRGLMKVGEEKLPVRVAKGDPDADEAEYIVEDVGQGHYGDRVCYEAEPSKENGTLRSPFLDNRMGCFALMRLASLLDDCEDVAFDVVLGATACEEIGGFGAHVLASQVRPDAVVCIDATYEDEKQNVVLGGGPVLTLSDASVLLGAVARDRICGFFDERSIPLQTEVYNFSGTDSRAFPQQGISGPVLSLLVPTRGNHTPIEIGVVSDLDNLILALCEVCRTSLADGPFPGAFT